jgi:hypothetical protein
VNFATRDIETKPADDLLVRDSHVEVIYSEGIHIKGE